MPQHYSDPTRANDPHALPDVEVYGPVTTVTCALCGEHYMDERMGGQGAPDTCEHCGDYLKDEPRDRGYWWQYCFPGCLPDGDPVGPFPTEADALADAQRTSEE